MSAGAPWSVKGIDPKAREIAKDLARRSGMTLGEWLNQVILEDEAAATAEPAPRYPAFGRQSLPPQRRFEAPKRPIEDAFRVTDALDRLSARIEAAEQRSTAAIDGIEQAVAELMARMEGAEHDQNAVVSRFEGAVDGLRAEQARSGERLRRIEQEAADTRIGDALQSLEGALSKLAAHVHGGEEQARQSFDGLRQELDGVHERLEDAFTEAAARELVEGVIARLSGRLEQAEQRTTDALHGLETAFAELDARLSATEAQARDSSREDRLEALAASLAEQMDAVRAEMAESIRASAADDRFERVEQALAEINDHVRAAEERSAGAIEKMGHEVLRMADTLGRSVRESEQRAGQAIAQVRQQVSGDVSRMADGLARSVDEAERRSKTAIEQLGGEVARVGGEVARMSEAVEARLSHADAAGAQALERLGAEIARISERLTERVANAERRSAQAIDDVGDQVARATERLHDRQERVSSELADRIRQSEERTARILDEARARIDQRLAEAQRRAGDAAAPPAAATAHQIAYSTYADPAVAPFGDDSFAAAVEAVREPLADFDGPAEAQAAAAPAFAPADVAAAHGADDETEAADVRDGAAPFGEALARGEDDPFGDDDFIEPARPAHEREDFGAGLFTEPERPEAPADDDDWLSPVPEGQGAHAHEAEAADENEAPIHPFGLARPADEAEPPAAESDDGFEATDEFVAEPERPRSTRELIEQARAAARAAAQPQDAKAREGRGSLFGGLGRGGKKKRGGATMRTALLVSGGTAAMGVALAGYVIMADKPHGALPDRVAEALGVHAAATGHAATGGAPAPAGLAAVALAPKPIAGVAAGLDQTAPLPNPDAAGGAELYNDAVRRIEARDKTGVATLQKAANLGYAPAEFYLAKLYEDGQAGLHKDLVEARRWTERAAEGGDRKAMHNLALYYFEGAGGPKNLTSAAQWFRRAADLGLVDSQYNLARLYEEGFGVPQNPAEAYKWYLIAGRSGDAESRMSALRLKSQLSPEAQSAAERAAQGFQPQAPQPIGGAPVQDAVGGDPAAVATAQKALTRLGFYQGPADGAPSPALKLAIMAYQRGQGLPATGQLDPALNQRLTAVVQQ